MFFIYFIYYNKVASKEDRVGAHKTFSPWIAVPYSFFLNKLSAIKFSNGSERSHIIFTYYQHIANILLQKLFNYQAFVNIITLLSNDQFLAMCDY